MGHGLELCFDNTIMRGSVVGGNMEPFFCAFRRLRRAANLALGVIDKTNSGQQIFSPLLNGLATVQPFLLLL